MKFKHAGLHFMKLIFVSSIRIFIAVVVLGGIPVANGQPVPQASNEYNFNVIYLSFPDPEGKQTEQPLNLKFFSDEKAINLSAHEGGISRYFSHKGESRLYFFREAGTDEEGEIIYKPILNVDLGKSGQKLIFVIRKPNGSLGGQVFDMNLKAFPLNSLQLFNFSQKAMKARVADSVGTIAPFKAKNFAVEVEQRKIALDFALATEVDGRAKVIEMTRLAFRKNGRRLILVHNDPRNSEEIRYRVFPIARPTAVDNVSDTELEVEDYEKYRREERMMQ
jgi:hypothetical protein